MFLVDRKPGTAGITQPVDGSAWHNGHPLGQILATVRWEAQQPNAIGAPVPLLCVHNTRIPWDEIYADNVPVLAPGLAAGVAALPASPHG